MIADLNQQTLCIAQQVPQHSLVISNAVLLVAQLLYSATLSLPEWVGDYFGDIVLLLFACSAALSLCAQYSLSHFLEDRGYFWPREWRFRIVSNASYTLHAAGLLGFLLEVMLTLWQRNLVAFIVSATVASLTLLVCLSMIALHIYDAQKRRR